MAVELTVAVDVAASAGGVVAARVAVEVGGSRVAVAMLVAVIAGFVGGGAVVAVASVQTEIGVWVNVGRCEGTGVRVGRSAMLVGIGVGVSRKTPVTTGSLSTSCPSSRRITSNTAGSRGATFA